MTKARQARSSAMVCPICHTDFIANRYIPTIKVDGKYRCASPDACSRRRSNVEKLPGQEQITNEIVIENPCVVCAERPVWIKKVGKCKRCYHREYKRSTYVPRPRELRGIKAGSTPETATPCSYSAAHGRVRTARGNPNDHNCVVCGEEAKEWAYRGDSQYEIRGEYRAQKRGKIYMHQGRWSPYIWDYDPLCIDCHQLRDAKVFTFELSEGVILKVSRTASITPKVIKILEQVVEDDHVLMIIQARMQPDTVDTP